MFLSSITIKNFRKYGFNGSTEQGLSVNFHKGLNALVGENDSGKSTIIDAIKMVLQTQSGDYIRVEEDDFYIDSNQHSATEFTIDCLFDDLAPNEAKNFIEWLTYIKNSETQAVTYQLQLHFRAWKENSRIFTELKAGNDDDGILLDGKARELLKCVYLRPLRDAEREMRSGRNSRISQILYNHPLFKNKEDNELVSLLKAANTNIKKYFEEDDGKEILGKIRDTLKEFLDQQDPTDASIKTSDMRLKAILESLSLVSPEIHPGLGAHNLLFIAAELLLLNAETSGCAKLALIEELEAHLHPQAQLRLISYLQKEYNDSGVQIIVSTHSPVLASKINVKNLILIKGGNAFDLRPEHTKLDKGDYLFLQRFLDSSKANFFFAKGIIMVEGDAEALFIPTLADILGINLEKHGISIVNVGNIGFFRYSKIFLRADGNAIPVPVSIITDCDIQPERTTAGLNIKDTETSSAISTKEAKYNDGPIKAFITPRWTFEYTVALSTLRDMLYESILQAKKIENSDVYTLTPKKIEEISKTVSETAKEWAKLGPHEIAFFIYNDTMLDKGLPVKAHPAATSKAIVAQCLASNLRWSIIDTSSAKDGGAAEHVTKEKMFDLDLYQTEVDEKKRLDLASAVEADPYLAYIVNAIKHAAGLDKEENEG